MSNENRDETGPKPVRQSTALKFVVEKNKQSKTAAPAKQQPGEKKPGEKKPRSAPKPSTAKKVEKLRSISVPFSTRIPESMLKRLRTLSFHRRINGDDSHTVQRIVEEALAKYLGEQKEATREENALKQTG